MSTVLGKLASVGRQQRLSIQKIHDLWNEELHRSAGHRPFRPKNIGDIRLEDDTFHPDFPPDIRKFSAQLQQVSKFGTWLDGQDNEVTGEPLNYQLIELVANGHLPVYDSANPEEPACAPGSLKGISLRRKTLAYFIDRDDLGCLLVANGSPLPAFWYGAGDAQIYRDRLQRKEGEQLDRQRHVQALLRENEELKRQLLEARPFMNPDHPSYSAELEAAVSVWLAHFDTAADELPPHPRKEDLHRWLLGHRPAVVQNADGSPIQKPLERIGQVANPNKSGGRPN